MEKAWSEPSLTPAERLVLLALQHEPGASVARLETLTGMEPQTIKRAAKALKSVKLITSEVA